MQTSPIAVLGMHRSGTSCLTGLLEDAGVWLGDVSKSDPFNRKGNQERREIAQLHDRVLADNGALWDAPPAGDCRWPTQRVAELRAILSDYPADRRWGIKDPRACFTVSGWLQERPDLRLVGTFRHPAAVAASLRKRAGWLPLTDEIELWCAYNAQLLRLHERFGFPLVCFDLPPERYLGQVSNILAGLGLTLAPPDALFFDPALRAEAVPPEAPLPAAARPLYQRLTALAG